MNFVRELCCRKDDLVIQPRLALFLELNDGENSDNPVEDLLGGLSRMLFQKLSCLMSCEMGGKGACPPGIDGRIIYRP